MTPQGLAAGSGPRPPGIGAGAGALSLAATGAAEARGPGLSQSAAPPAARRDRGVVTVTDCGPGLGKDPTESVTITAELRVARPGPWHRDCHEPQAVKRRRRRDSGPSRLEPARAASTWAAVPVPQTCDSARVRPGVGGPDPQAGAEVTVPVTSHGDSVPAAGTHCDAAHLEPWVMLYSLHGCYIALTLL